MYSALMVSQGGDYSLSVYTPMEGTESYWGGTEVPISVLKKAMGSCLPVFVPAP